MLAGANIPFNATNNSQVRQFLKDHTRNGGAIPKATGSLPYLFDVYKSNLEISIQKLKNKKLYFLTMRQVTNNKGL